MKPVKSTLLALSAAAMLAGPALASEASLSRDVGVAPGKYSVQQLAQLKALDGDQHSQRAYILAHPANPDAQPAPEVTRTLYVIHQSRPQGGTPTGQDELADSVGVRPGLYSTDQLIRIGALQNGGNGDQAVLDYILAHPAGPGAS
ncbi:hypothetical protein [Oceanicola sp. 502str15]|uniref:hypothetical protein n=1 Tax=Oceanicola sp. 502str15 TaxID=2696061 RepID=UPI0020949407|nr:hypothetical protein [Oceanicola sp. 502str15]MCO6382539.1 hypothetical protein [Oceanicola sp. 502str15]